MLEVRYAEFRQIHYKASTILDMYLGSACSGPALLINLSNSAVCC